MLNRGVTSLKDINDMLERFLYVFNDVLGYDLSVNSMNFCSNIGSSTNKIEVYFLDHDDPTPFMLLFEMSSNELISVINDNGNDYFMFRDSGLSDDMINYIKTGKVSFSSFTLEYISSLMSDNINVVLLSSENEVLACYDGKESIPKRFNHYEIKHIEMGSYNGNDTLFFTV
jgi:hypothetical protein